MSNYKVNLDIALLRTFVATVDLGSVARAAEQIGRSQPATSLQLKRLEEVTGDCLFRKNGRNIELTAAGDALLVYSRRLLELNDETVTSIKTIMLSGSIRLGISQDFASDWLTQILAGFSLEYPSVSIEVTADRNPVLSDLLSKFQLDMALMFGIDEIPGTMSLGQIPIAWIGTKDRAFKNENCIPLVTSQPPCGLKNMAIDALKSAGMPWRVSFSSPNLSCQRSAIEAGLGISVRTSIGLKDPLTILGEEDGLPSLPEFNLHLLLHRSQEKQDEFVKKLQEILVKNIREKLKEELLKN